MPIRATHETFDAILEMNNIEVYKETDGFATELQVRKDLGLVDCGDRINGLQFYYHQVFNEKVYAISDLQFYSLVYHW